MTSENETVNRVTEEMKMPVYRYGEVDSVMSLRLRDFAERVDVAHRHEVAELRECLKEAVDLYCLHLEKSNCMCRVSLSVSIDKWRKALRGGAE